jgi:hypothetical protein
LGLVRGLGYHGARGVTQARGSEAVVTAPRLRLAGLKCDRGAVSQR